MGEFLGRGRALWGCAGVGGRAGAYRLLELAERPDFAMVVAGKLRNFRVLGWERVLKCWVIGEFRCLG